MSIPPFVCSTPPPPEQCEDDKDHVDFDLQYQLPQDDDDEHYDYTNYSSYNFEPEPSPKKAITKVLTPEYEDSISKTPEDYIVDDNEERQNCNEQVNECNKDETTMKGNTIKCDEEFNIEDLNLIIDKESICSNIDDDQKESPTDVDETVDKNLNIPCVKSEDILDDENGLAEPSSSRSEHIYSNTTVDIDLTAKKLLKEDNFIEPQNTIVKPDHETEAICNNEILFVENFPDPFSNVPTTEILEIASNKDKEQVIDQPSKQIGSFSTDHFIEAVEEQQKNKIIETDEDLGDFDDFQFTNSERKCSTVIDDFQDPWCDHDSVESDFGNFTANFDQVETQKPISESIDNTEIQNNDQLERDTKQENLQTDDFGDFDDFKSSSAHAKENTTTKEDTYQEVPVLNWSSSDNEPLVLDSINKVLSEIFEEEITEPECEFEGKLESLLSETWGHLMEIDERQPYIVNWNNSLGQKTLLKSLCIDSRNILFGPKWSYNMPKYAANLSSAPLQPQRQASTDTCNNENMSIEKPATKPNNWGDPFTSEGQDFTYAEALLLDLEHLMATLDQMAHNHSTLKISDLLSQACNSNQIPENESSSTNVQVFSEVMSPEANKVFSNTLNVQPIRQISLPDTHIFTPTDSKTPRSKTIHYDSQPTVILPHPIKETNKIQIESSALEPTSNTDDGDYWEFQDFKGTSNMIIPKDEHHAQTSESRETTNSYVSPTTTIGFQTQLLQPIKIDPVMPTLNWPDPGQVKETFDDFSDFVGSDWSQEKAISVLPEKTVDPNDISTLDKTNQITDSERTKEKSEVTISSEINAFDDEFETFKCALPTANNIMNAQSILSITPTPQEANFEHDFSKMNVKSDSISLVSENKPEAPNTSHFSNPTRTTTKIQPTLSSGLPILQPTTAYSAVTTNPQNTAQILQPLSLESFSQINWPSPGIDLQDLSRFNPVETLQSLKTDLSAGNQSKMASPVHNQKNVVTTQVSDDDVWGEFISSKPKTQNMPRKSPVFADDDEWTDFVSSPSVVPQNGVNTISFNVHTNSNMKSANQNKFNIKSNQKPLDIPTLNYITPKAGNQKTYNERHFQNL